MKNFVVIYHAPASWMEQAQHASPEEMQNGMEQWMEWAGKCGDALVDFGAPLAGGQKLSTSGSSSSDKGVTGYSILQAEDMDGAKALLEGHPHLEWAARSPRGYAAARLDSQLILACNRRTARSNCRVVFD